MFSLLQMEKARAFEKPVIGTLVFSRVVHMSAKRLVQDFCKVRPHSRSLCLWIPMGTVLLVIHFDSGAIQYRCFRTLLNSFSPDTHNGHGKMKERTHKNEQAHEHAGRDRRRRISSPTKSSSTKNCARREHTQDEQ